MSRRSALAAAAAVFAGTGAARAEDAPAAPKGRLKQSVSRWCYGGISLDDLCQHAKRLGLAGIDLLKEEEWETVRKHGLTCPMAYGIGTIPEGWNRVENHDRLVTEAEAVIPKIAKAGWPNVITFSGNRRGLSDAEGLENCVAGLKRIVKLAEENHVTVCMELLNSRHDHKDYQCDHAAWGVEVARHVGSDRIRLLYDIYHMQIMDGDICATLREHFPYFAHYHTGGVPGRHEIDETQELNDRKVCQTLAELGFKGYVAHEFLPTRDPITSLRQAIQICDV